MFLRKESVMNEIIKLDILAEAKFESSNFYNADTGGRRNEKPLSAEQKKMVSDYAVSLGMRKNGIFFTDDYLTGYGDLTDRLRVGTDVFPKDSFDENETANSRMSWKCTVAHEIIGHRESWFEKRALVSGEDLFAYQADELSTGEHTRIEIYTRFDR